MRVLATVPTGKNRRTVGHRHHELDRGVGEEMMVTGVKKVDYCRV